MSEQGDPKRRKLDHDSNISSNNQSNNQAADQASHQQDIAAHYNSVVRSLADRGQSQIIGLRNFNNWIKSVLIDQTIQSVNQSEHIQSNNQTILDLCGGKGGDLKKFKIARIGRYVCADHADQSIIQAVERYHGKGLNDPFPALFVTADCHKARLSKCLLPDDWFDVVSCQFALHYSFETEARARDFLFNAAERLRPGGKFIATFPNADTLVSGWRKSGTNIAFQNSICTVRFAEIDEINASSQLDPNTSIDLSVLQSSEHFPTQHTSSCFSPLKPFGLKYWFNLTDAIDDCPEYLVHLPTLVSLAAMYGLELVEARGLHTYFNDHASDNKYDNLLRLMKVTDEQGNMNMSQDEWDTLNLYQAVVFRKRKPESFKPGEKSVLYTEPPVSAKRVNQSVNQHDQPRGRKQFTCETRRIEAEAESFTAQILQQSATKE